MTLERWDGKTWDVTTAVIRGPGGNRGTRGPGGSRGSSGSSIAGITSVDNKDGTFNIVFTLSNRTKKTITTPNLKGADVTQVLAGNLNPDGTVDLTFLLSDSTTKVVKIPLPTGLQGNRYLEESISIISQRNRVSSSWTNLSEFTLDSSKNNILRVEVNYYVLRAYPTSDVEYQIIDQSNGSIYFSGMLPARTKGAHLEAMLKNVDMPKKNGLHLLIRARLGARRPTIESRNVILTIIPTK